MFTIDDTITDLKLKNKTMVKVLFSMNNHQVATPEMMLEEARSFIMFFREPAGRLSSCIALHLLATGRKLFYVHSSNPFPEEDRSGIEDEALAFVEGLGALIDTVDFSDLSSEEKERWIEQHEIFAQPATPAPRGERDAEPQEEPALQLEPPQAPPPVQSVSPAHPVSQPPEPFSQRQNYQNGSRPQIPPNNHRIQASRPPQPPPAPHMPQEILLEDGETDDTELQPSDPAEEQDYSPRPQVRETGKTAVSRGVNTAKPYGHPAVVNGAAARERQETVRKAVKSGGVRPGKPQIRRETPPTAGVVSRDREALARLLTSF